MRLGEYFDQILYQNCFFKVTCIEQYMLMGFPGIFPMNKHEILSNFVHFGIYFNRKFKICFKYLIILENINIGHLNISRDYFWP